MKIFVTVFYSFFILVLLLVAGLFFMPLLPIADTIQIKIVESGSMEPAILTGSLVVVRPQTDYVVGDVITFTSISADVPTTHRIVAARTENGETLFATKGDANEEADSEETNLQSVLGKVLLTVPYVGFILDFARQPIGFSLLIILPALLIVLGEIEKIWKEIKRRRQKSAHKLAESESAISPLKPSHLTTPPIIRMMDIKCPVYLPGYHVPAAIPVMVQTTASSFLRDSVPAAAIVLASLLFAGMSFIGGTVSYFNDTEGSFLNLLQASLLDFKVTADGALYDLKSGETAQVATVVVPETASVAVLYTVTVEKITGSDALCDAILVTGSSPVTYSGPLLDLTDTAVDFNNAWELLVSLATGTPVYLPGDTCGVEVVYTGWSEAGNAGEGYFDEERVPLTFTAPASLLQRINFATTTADTVPEIETETEVEVVLDANGTTTESTLIPETTDDAPVEPKVGEIEEIVPESEIEPDDETVPPERVSLPVEVTPESRESLPE